MKHHITDRELKNRYKEALRDICEYLDSEQRDNASGPMTRKDQPIACEMDKIARDVLEFRKIFKKRKK